MSMPFARAAYFLLLWTMMAVPAAAQTVADGLHEAEEQLADARSTQLNLLAPRSFERAETRFREAQQRHARGSRADVVQRLLEQVHEHLTEAEVRAEVGRTLLGEALQARAGALDVNAPEFADAPWQEAESHLQRAGRDLERGDTRTARQRAAQATQAYQAAELQAIRTEVLDLARRLRSEAISKDAERWAPATFKEAESSLRRAEGVLESDRVQYLPQARTLAASAAAHYQRAARIADVAKAVHRDPRTQVESLILDQEAQVRRITDTLHFEPDFISGTAPVVTQAITAISSLYQNNRYLQQELAERGREIEQLNERIEALEAQLADVEEREQSVTAELRAREQREQKMNRVRTVFAADEAEVILSPEEILIRLNGLSFPVGSDEIRPENFLLLANVQRVLRMFPEASIVVAGHTDAQGNDDHNMALSQRRAEAVREYLLANMELNPSRVRAVGRGETQPIASNDTQEGRAKNRRIDVILDLSDY